MNLHHLILFLGCYAYSAHYFCTQKKTTNGLPPESRLVMAADAGFEPTYTESESAVLPLH